jgi:hypothetical protein
LPVGPSQWLRHDVPTRIQQLFSIPVELVTPPSNLELDLTGAGARVATGPELQVEEAVAAT